MTTNEVVANAYSVAIAIATSGDGRKLASYDAATQPSVATKASTMVFHRLARCDLGIRSPLGEADCVAYCIRQPGGFARQYAMTSRKPSSNDTRGRQPT